MKAGGGDGLLGSRFPTRARASVNVPGRPISTPGARAGRDARARPRVVQPPGTARARWRRATRARARLLDTYFARPATWVHLVRVRDAAEPPRRSGSMPIGRSAGAGGNVYDGDEPRWSRRTRAGAAALLGRPHETRRGRARSQGSGVRGVVGHRAGQGCATPQSGGGRLSTSWSTPAAAREKLFRSAHIVALDGDGARPGVATPILTDGLRDRRHRTRRGAPFASRSRTRRPPRSRGVEIGGPEGEAASRRRPGRLEARRTRGATTSSRRDPPTARVRPGDARDLADRIERRGLRSPPVDLRRARRCLCAPARRALLEADRHAPRAHRAAPPEAGRKRVGTSRIGSTRGSATRRPPRPRLRHAPKRNRRCARLKPATLWAASWRRTKPTPMDAAP